jgi:SAM-dependent methyltransferase
MSLRARLTDLSGRIERERHYWRTSHSEQPGQLSVELLVHKMREAGAFLEAVDRNHGSFDRAGAILEIGGGQGWAACLVKRLFGPDKTVMTSDVGPAAIESVPAWETVLSTKLDGAFACPSFEIPLDDASVDLVFAFDAAHHFGAHRRTLVEIRRVLRPGGRCLYLHEPTVPPFLYRFAVDRLNRKRAGYGHDVIEDVLVGQRLLSIAEELGFEARRTFAPSLAAHRGARLAYYAVVGRLGGLQRLLPSTADFVLTARPDPARRERAGDA